MTIEEIGQAIRSRRKMLDVSLMDLSELSGVNMRSIIYLEKGEGNPSLKTIQRVATVLGLELQLTLRNKEA